MITFFKGTLILVVLFLTLPPAALASLECPKKLHHAVLNDSLASKNSGSNNWGIVVKEFKRDRKPGEIESGGILLKPGQALDFKALGLDPYGEYIYVRTSDGYTLVSPRSPAGASEDAYFMSHRGLVVEARKLLGENVEFVGAGELITTDNHITSLNSKSGYLQGNSASLQDTIRDFESRGQNIYKEDDIAVKDIAAKIAKGLQIDRDHVAEQTRARKEYEYNNDPKYAGLRREVSELKEHYSYFLSRYPEKVPENYKDSHGYYPGDWPLESMIQIEGPLFSLVPMINREGITAFLVKVEENGGESALADLNRQFRAQRQSH